MEYQMRCHGRNVSDQFYQLELDLVIVVNALSRFGKYRIGKFLEALLSPQSQRKLSTGSELYASSTISSQAYRLGDQFVALAGAANIFLDMAIFWWRALRVSYREGLPSSPVITSLAWRHYHYFAP